MRFPALLSAKLAKARVAGFLRGTRPAHLIDFVDAAEVLHAGSAHPISHERIRDLLGSPAPILWIGGSEPLEHPGIAHLVRAIVQGGRFVFLETCGTLLRRRIHEFQPVPQLFLTVRSDGPPPSVARNLRNPSAFELALEGLHAAQLSGFFTAVHSPVKEDADLSWLQILPGILSVAEVDGWMITAATTGNSASRRAREARNLIPNAQWRWLSVHVEREVLSAEKTSGLQHSPGNGMHPAQACEESIRAS
jgi:MoaA/NifB/PqqE/SkfB family radical SAM enzyme